MDLSISRNITPLMVLNSRWELHCFPISHIAPIFSCACTKQWVFHRVVQGKMKLAAFSGVTYLVNKGFPADQYPRSPRKETFHLVSWCLVQLSSLGPMTSSTTPRKASLGRIARCCFVLLF